VFSPNGNQINCCAGINLCSIIRAPRVLQPGAVFSPEFGNRARNDLTAPKQMNIGFSRF
jgi:hypothetical protein